MVNSLCELKGCPARGHEMMREGAHLPEGFPEISSQCGPLNTRGLPGIKPRPNTGAGVLTSILTARLHTRLKLI